MEHLGTSIDGMSLTPDELSFGIDTVDAASFYPARRVSIAEPILRLMSAVLMDAIRCFQRNFESRHPYKRQEFREAQFWIFHDKGKGPFSFEDVCETLKIDPRRLRNLISRWGKERRSGDKPRSVANLVERIGSHRSGPKPPSDLRSGSGMHLGSGLHSGAEKSALRLSEASRARSPKRRINREASSAFAASLTLARTQQ